MATFIFAFALLPGAALGLDNGVARTPPMGWNPYNAYSCDTTESQYRATAEAMVQLGFKDLGYRYVNMDCGWQSNKRLTNGTFMWNATRFPSGIPALADYVHGLGLLFGAYSDAGYYSCDNVNGKAHWIGSLGHEQSDADTFAAWGIDYLSYDNCYAVSKTDFADHKPHIQEEPHYTVMRDALAKTGRKILYSVREWGIQDPAQWAGSVCNAWRISNNIGPPPSFASLRRIINQLVPITIYARPGAWNDLDTLEVGNEGLTETEWAAQFAFWAAAKSPLIISTDLTSASKSAQSILGNKWLIAVNQDSLGRSVTFKRRYTDNFDVWAGPLADGSMVVVLLNWQNTTQQIVFDLFDVDLVSADLTDLWTGIDLGTVTTSCNVTADAHGALVYKLSNVIRVGLYEFTFYDARNSSNVLTGGAKWRKFDASRSVVSHIGHGATLTFVGVDGGTRGGKKLLSLSYINGDYTFSNTDCPNCRRAQVSVNGGTPVWVEMPISGQDWKTPYEGYLLTLDGFTPGSSNKITFGNPNGWAPNMYRIGVRDEGVNGG